MSTDRNNLVSTYDTIQRFVIPFLILILGWQHSEINQIEDKLFVLQKEAVSQTMLNQTEGRIMNYMDTRIRDLDNKLTVLINQQSLIMESMQKK